MINSSPRAWATIDLHALKKNLSRVSVLCPDSQIIPVIKANAYGHGVEQVALTLKAGHTSFAAFAVASMEEAMQLRTLGINTPIQLLCGFRNRSEMQLCLNHNIEPVVHSMYQFEELARYLQNEILSGVGRIWIKYNSGMNRLGLNREQALQVYGDLHKHPETEVVLMSHLACADDAENQAAIEFTKRQIAEFDSLSKELSNTTQGRVQGTLAASAGILDLPQIHHQFVRPGIMLYGGSPIINRSAEEIGLSPVMTLRARIIAINDVDAGEQYRLWRKPSL